LSSVAVLGDPSNPAHESQVQELRSIAVKRALKIVPVHVRESEALDLGMVRARQSAAAVIVLSGTLTTANQGQLINLAAKHKLPAMYLLREAVIAGGLMAYGPDFVIIFRRSAEYVDKILKGARPADMPIEQATQYILAVNLKTAKSLGLVIPPSILVRADEVVQ